MFKNSFYPLILILTMGITACGGGSSPAVDNNSQNDKEIKDPITETPNEPPPEPPTEPELPEETPPANNEVTPINIPSAVRLNNDSCIPPEPTVTNGTPSREKAFPNLPAIPAVLALVQPKSDNSFWFILNRAGHVYQFDNSSNVNSYTEVLDLSHKVTTSGEMGMTGIAFHPNYGNGDDRIFILYNDSSQQNRSTLSSFTVNSTTKVINANSEQVLLTLDQPIPYHNGGDLAFGNDGMLYASFGDGEFEQEAQRLDNLYGTLIRIDVSTTPYSIPSDNPFNTSQSLCNSYDAARTTNCPEIFAYGLRNPWRFSIDSATGTPWLGDVGDSSLEEVDRIISGGNYGWPIMEGTQCTNPNPNCNKSLYQLPIAEYERSLGVSVIGGYVYRGSQSPSLVGKYIFGDVYGGNFFTVDANAPANSNETALFSSHGVASMAEGNDGEVYLLRFFDESEVGTGINVYRIIGGGGTSINMPANLSDTGCFNVTDKTSPAGVFEYTTNSPLWSDGAAKKRAFAIPNNTTIGVLADGDFSFPENSVLIKHFLNGNTFLETRLLINHSSGWQGYSYEWNDSQTEATLLTAGKTKDVGDFIHTYPSQSDCGECHTNAANFSAGIELAQLNKVNNTLNANQIDYLHSANYLADVVSSTSSNTLYNLTDENATLEQKARSYLHTNCSTCHRPGVTNRAHIDLRYTTTLADTNACDVTPELNSVGDSNSKIIAPGNADNSILLTRMISTETNIAMPPLAKLKEDQQATALIRQWINSLSSCE